MESCDSKLEELEALAPDYEYTRMAVRNRLSRTNVSREERLRILQLRLDLEMDEYDREARVRDIDLAWMDVRATRNQLRIVGQRKRKRERSPCRRSSTTTCSICQEEDAPLFRLRRCGHEFHINCLGDYVSHLAQGVLPRCPNCRARLDSNDQTEIIRHINSSADQVIVNNDIVNNDIANNDIVNNEMEEDYDNSEYEEE